MNGKNMKLKFYIIFFSIIILQPLSSFAWDNYEKVLAVVNSRAVMESDVNQKLDRMKLLKNIPAAKINYEKSRILDQMIEAEIIFETAQNESILLSDKRVINQLEGAMTKFFSSRGSSEKELTATVERVSTGMEKFIENKFEANFKIDPDLKKFIDFIEKKEKMDFFSFFDEMKVNIAREQIMSVAIGANPPSAEEAKKWYNANKSKLGFEVHVKHILIIPKSGSLTDEKNANTRAEELRKQIMSNPGSFEALAIKNSQDPGSAKAGGDLGWQMLAQLDPYFAGNVFKLTKSGQISGVFKSGFGYHIVKYLDRKAVTYEKVEKMIMYKLYSENAQDQFKKWVKQKKEEASITIYMDGYIKGQ
jgi:putative peptidyl-prolyl cis-trans isomerase